MHVGKTICSSKLIVFYRLHSQKTVHFLEQMMSVDNFQAYFFMPNEGYFLYTYMYLKHMLHFRVLVEVVGHLELQVGEIHVLVTCYECKISVKLPTINQTDWFSDWWINWLTTAFNCDKCILVTLNNICYSKNHNDAIHILIVCMLFFLFVIGLFFSESFHGIPTNSNSSK